MTQSLEKLSQSVLLLSKLISARSSASFEERAATKLQFAALSFLKENKGAHVRDLAQDLKLSMPSCTQLLERMVKAGFVKRSENKQDRRKTDLVLTQEGEKEHLRTKEKILSKMQAVFGILTPQEMEDVIRINQKIIDHLNSHS